MGSKYRKPCRDILNNGDGLSRAVGVIGGIGHDDAGGHALDQRQGLVSILRDRPTPNYLVLRSCTLAARHRGFF